jgi:hypothetical protein
MKKLIVLFVIILAFTACEKEPIIPCPTYNNVVGKWVLTRDVNGTPTTDVVINGATYNYTLIIHTVEYGECEEYRNGVFNRSYRFYLTVADDSMYFSYEYSTPVMLPEFGWNNYLQWDNVLLIEYQTWIKK